MVKKSAFAEYYEHADVALDKQIAECFSDKNGPGDLPLSKKTKHVQAIIVPHDAYVRAGPCMAWAYKEVAESEFPNLFIVIGPNHESDKNAVSLEGYETPFGLARVDKEFANALLQKNTELSVDEDAHEKEYSVGVQIPFLQFATKENMHELKIVPILVGTVDYARLALDIKETLLETGKKAIIIVSANFTHYGRLHRHVPFSEDVKTKIYDQDRKAIEFIEQLNADGFVQFINDTMMNVCNVGGIATLLRTLKESAVSLEQYYTSADLEEEQTYKNAISYAAIIFAEPSEKKDAE